MDDFHLEVEPYGGDVVNLISRESKPVKLVRSGVFKPNRAPFQRRRNLGKVKLIKREGKEINRGNK